MTFDKAHIATESRRIVETLTHDFPSRSGLNPDVLSGAASYLEKEFQALKLSVESHYFSVSRPSVRNLVVTQTGRDTSKPSLIIGAHYDTVVDTPGADDNASGVAGLLELTRLLKDYPNNHTIQYVAFTHEEPPYFYTSQMGSRAYAKKLKNEHTNVHLMFSLEMIGYASDDIIQKYPFPLMRQIARYPVYGNFIGVVGNLRTSKFVRIVREAMRKGCGIDVVSLSAPGFLPPLFLSDHASFWRYGFPAVMITDTAFLRNPHYHLPSDTSEMLNYNFLSDVVMGICASVIALDQMD
ncbi:MAG TPA: M28 family peptidase [Bacteroidota bacterium]|nr:M28 family peptidase [Bacteroidota bacterium]